MLGVGRGHCDMYMAIIAALIESRLEALVRFGGRFGGDEVNLELIRWKEGKLWAVGLAHEALFYLIRGAACRDIEARSLRRRWGRFELVTLVSCHLLHARTMIILACLL